MRLKGKALEKLRIEVFERVNGKCEACGISTNFGHMAHIKSRGAGGSDTLENTEWLCATCHAEQHNLGRFTACKKRRNYARINIEVCMKCQYFNDCHERTIK